MAITKFVNIKFKEKKKVFENLHMNKKHMRRATEDEINTIFN